MKSQNGKNPTKLEIIYEIKIKRRRLDKIEQEKEKKSNREKDYGRLRSVNDNERKVKNEKRRLN